MTKSVNNFLFCEDFTTDRALHTGGQTGFGTSCIHCGDGFFCMAEGVDNFLCYKDFTADRAMFAFGKTGCRAGRCDSCINFFCVSKCSFFNLRCVVATRAGYISIPTGFGTGRSLCFVCNFIMIESIGDNCFICITYGTISSVFACCGAGGSSAYDPCPPLVTGSFNSFLCYKNFTADITMTAFGKTAFGTGCGNSDINDFCMTEGIRCISVFGGAAVVCAGVNRVAAYFTGRGDHFTCNHVMAECRDGFGVFVLTIKAGSEFFTVIGAGSIIYNCIIGIGAICVLTVVCIVFTNTGMRGAVFNVRERFPLMCFGINGLCTFFTCAANGAGSCFFTFCGASGCKCFGPIGPGVVFLCNGYAVEYIGAGFIGECLVAARAEVMFNVSFGCAGGIIECNKLCIVTECGNGFSLFGTAVRALIICRTVGGTGGCRIFLYELVRMCKGFTRFGVVGITAKRAGEGAVCTLGAGGFVCCFFVIVLQCFNCQFFCRSRRGAFGIGKQSVTCRALVVRFHTGNFTFRINLCYFYNSMCNDGQHFGGSVAAGAFKVRGAGCGAGGLVAGILGEGMCGCGLHFGVYGIARDFGYGRPGIGVMVGCIVMLFGVGRLYDSGSCSAVVILRFGNGVAVCINEFHGIFIDSLVEVCGVGCIARDGGNGRCPACEGVCILCIGSLDGISIGWSFTVCIGLRFGNAVDFPCDGIVVDGCVIGGGVGGFTGYGNDLLIPTGKGISILCGGCFGRVIAVVNRCCIGINFGGLQNRTVIVYELDFVFVEDFLKRGCVNSFSLDFGKFRIPTEETVCISVGRVRNTNRCFACILRRGAVVKIRFLQQCAVIVVECDLILVDGCVIMGVIGYICRGSRHRRCSVKCARSVRRCCPSVKGIGILCGGCFVGNL